MTEDRFFDHKLRLRGILHAAGILGEVEWIPNAYWPEPRPEEEDDYAEVRTPWMRVVTEHGHLIVGWRKRVIQIDWSATDIPISGSDVVANQDVTHGDMFCHAWGWASAADSLKRLWSYVSDVATRPMTISRLQITNFVRCAEVFYEPDSKPVSYYAMALAGEVGELCNKLRELDDGWNIPHSKIEEEFGDILPYLVLLASRARVNLEEVTIRQFNEVSVKQKSTLRLPMGVSDAWVPKGTSE